MTDIDTQDNDPATGSSNPLSPSPSLSSSHVIVPIIRPDRNHFDVVLPFDPDFPSTFAAFRRGSRTVGFGRAGDAFAAEEDKRACGRHVTVRRDRT
jgi:hypothetical protein